MKSNHINLLEGIVKRHPDGFGFLFQMTKNTLMFIFPLVKWVQLLLIDRVKVLVHRKRKAGDRSYFGLSIPF